VETDWKARRRLADAHAALAVAQAHGLDADRTDLEELYPAEFAAAVHTWAEAHPSQPEPLLGAGFDVRSGSGAVAWAMGRAQAGRTLTSCCAEWVHREDLAVDPDDRAWLLTRCRRCVAREKAAADA
jgi:hypothetical protein